MIPWASYPVGRRWRRCCRDICRRYYYLLFIVYYFYYHHGCPFSILIINLTFHMALLVLAQRASDTRPIHIFNCIPRRSCTELLFFFIRIVFLHAIKSVFIYSYLIEAVTPSGSLNFSTWLGLHAAHGIHTPYKTIIIETQSYVLQASSHGRGSLRAAIAIAMF